MSRTPRFKYCLAAGLTEDAVWVNIRRTRSGGKMARTTAKKMRPLARRTPAGTDLNYVYPAGQNNGQVSTVASG